MPPPINQFSHADYSLSFFTIILLSPPISISRFQFGSHPTSIQEIRRFKRKPDESLVHPGTQLIYGERGFEHPDTPPSHSAPCPENNELFPTLSPRVANTTNIEKRILLSTFKIVLSDPRSHSSDRQVIVLASFPHPRPPPPAGIFYADESELITGLQPSPLALPPAISTLETPHQPVQLRSIPSI